MPAQRRLLCVSGGQVRIAGGKVRVIQVLLVAAAILSSPAAVLIARSGGASSALDALSDSASPSSSAVVPEVPAPAAAAVPQLSGEELFQALHKSLNAQAAERTAHSYKQAKAFMHSTADNTDCEGRPGILTLYSQVCAHGSSGNGNDYKEQGDRNGDGIVDKIVNAEHLWPQSYFNRALPMVADVHQLASTFETPNSRRANLKFTLVSRAVYSTSSGSRLGADGFEPADAVKGNAARAMLYFVVRYYDRNIRRGMNYDDFWILRVPMFLEWNRRDPPDDNERRRNGLVEQFQGNRNPFIDDPSLADRIGAKVFQSH